MRSTVARRFSGIIGNQYVTGWWLGSQAKRVVCPCGRPKITLFVAGKDGHGARFKERNACWMPGRRDLYLLKVPR